MAFISRSSLLLSNPFWRSGPSQINLPCSSTNFPVRAGVPRFFHTAPNKGLKVVITGSSGFIGAGLAERLLARGELRDTEGRTTPISQILLFDMATSDDIKSLVSKKPGLFKTVDGSLTDKNLMRHIVSLNDGNDTYSGVSVFHLAAILSGHGEDEFSLCLDVNLDGTRNILEGLRALRSVPGSPLVSKFIFSSTIAVYGMVDTIRDDSPLEPLTTYGNTKVCCEKLLADYHRKQFLVGAGGRVPVVVLRPDGNRAASNCFNAVMREPLLGLDYPLPTPWDARGPLGSWSNVIDCLIHLHEIIRKPGSPEDAWYEEGRRVDDFFGPSRMVGFPARSFSMRELYTETVKYAKTKLGMSEAQIGKVYEKIDPQTAEIIRLWPKGIESVRAKNLGLPDKIEVSDILDEFVRFHRSHGKQW